MAEPITVEQARAYLHVDDDAEDAAITDAITDARGWIEDYTGLILTRRAVTTTLDSFGEKLKSWPITSIDSVAYTGPAGDAIALPSDAYVAQIASRPAALVALGTAWPRIYVGTPIVVTMTAGFDGADEINAYAPNLMRAMRLLLASFYADRETGGLAGDVDTAARRLCRNLKSWRL